MMRLSVVVAALLAFVSSAAASRSRLPELRLPQMPLNQSLDLLSRAARKVAAALSQPQYALTEETEVKLNGRPVNYNDVPDSAQIILLEVGPDQKTIRRIHFEKKK